MGGIESSLPEVEARYNSLDDLFLDRLGFPFPETPNILPLEILLPETAYGGLLEAILAQELDDPHLETGEARERSQFVGILQRRSGRVVDGPVSIGSPLMAKDLSHELRRWFSPLFGEKMTPLAYWHTHTPKANSPIPTESDIAQKLSGIKKGALYLHASPSEITAIIETKQARPKNIPYTNIPRIPFSAIKKSFDVYPRLVEAYNSEGIYEGIGDLANFLESNGYGLYMWQKPSGIATVRKGVEAGSFLNGIHLQRIGLSADIAKIKQRLRKS